MQGQHNFQPDSAICFNLETFIPPNHLLRKIDEQIELSFIKDLTVDYYCHHTGRPSIDPEIFFRMLLVGYLYGINTDRRLCEEVQYNLAYRWFCRLSLSDCVPDHSSFTRIRDRFQVTVVMVQRESNKMTFRDRDNRWVSIAVNCLSDS